jgi:capsular polysaccharide export protein
MLQGPSSPFMARVGVELRRLGHTVRRIDLCPGDGLFWRIGEATTYRGRLEDWPEYIDGYLAREAITDLVVFADGRPYQARAVAVAGRRGIRVHAIEHGYLRPDWITCERDGLGAQSRFPRDPEEIRALAEGQPLPDLAPIERESFLRYAVQDVAYHGANMVLGWQMTPHYQRYMLDHPLKEYAGWLVKFARARTTARAAERAVAAAFAQPGPLFVLPLQLSTDLQIRVHSPFAGQREAVDRVLGSFARHAPPDATLLVKVHPLDAGWDRWPARIAAQAGEFGIGGRVFVADGGSLEAMLGRAAGLVTVNSTVGLTALRAGVPVKVLGTAVYDVAGLTDDRPLDAFWGTPRRPDPHLLDAFLRALAATTQVRGEFTAEKSMTIGAKGVAERLALDGELLPPCRTG